MTLEEKAERWALERTGRKSILWNTLVNAYLAGAEPREKRIEELEKDNAELKSELTKKADTNHSLVEQMADLESKNAELKTKVENQKSFLERIRAKFELGEIERKEIEGYLESEQLTKAKEIIRQFLNDYPVITKELLDKLEQFIKDVEK